MKIFLTIRIATQTTLEDRFRLAALCLVGALVTAAVLLAGSASAARSAEQHRSVDMTGVLSDAPTATDLLVLSTTKRIEGRRIDVSYIEALGESSARPTGVDLLPSVGAAVVSPALRDLLETNATLADRFTVTDTIDPEGVLSGEQLLAYVRVSPGTLSQDGADIQHAVGGDYAGLGPVDRISAFGKAGPGEVSIQGTGLSDRWLEPTHVRAVWVLAVCPALVLLWVGLGISSEPRTGRMALLQFLGVPRRERIVISTVETLIPFVAGVVVACVAWRWIGHQVWVFAGARYDLLPGDAALSVGATTGVAAAVIGVAATVAVAMAALAKGPQGTRPVQEQSRLTRWAALPAGLSAGLLAAAATTPSQLDGLMALAGSALAAVSIPLLVPGVLRSVGRAIARTQSPATFLTGRFMGFDPASSARPFAGMATLIVLAGSCAGWITVASYVEDTPGSGSGTQVSVASWRTASVPDLTDRVGEELSDLVVTGFSVRGDQIVLDTSCEAVAAAASDVTCTEAGSLNGAGTDKLLRGLQTASEDGPLLADIAFAAGRSPAPEAEQLVVIGSGDGVVQDRRVESALGRFVEVPTVEGMSNSIAAPSALVPWIGFGLAMASVLLGAGCLLLISDRFRHVMTQHRALHLVGVTGVQMRRVARLLFVVPYAVISVAGLLLGTIACLTISAPVGIPWALLASLGVLTVVGGTAIGVMLPRRVRLPRID
jgi:hypothetical protein